MKARDLWRKMLTMLFETGHPWITFKDPSNIRSPQDHVGAVHSSNLCTEILLNTSEQETAVCNLGSINLAKHTRPDGLDEKKLLSLRNELIENYNQPEFKTKKRKSESDEDQARKNQKKELYEHLREDFREVFAKFNKYDRYYLDTHFFYNFQKGLMEDNKEEGSTGEEDTNKKIIDCGQKALQKAVTGL